MEARTLLEEVQEEERGFVIHSDKDAEYALTVIRQEQQEMARHQRLHDAERRRIDERLEALNAPRKSRILYYEQALRQYLETQPVKPTKSGLRALSFINGKVSIKPQDPEFKRDEEALGKWFHDSQMTGYYDTQYKPKWGEFKKNYRDHIKYYADGSVTLDGEFIQGVVAVEREDKLSVEVD